MLKLRNATFLDFYSHENVLIFKVLLKQKDIFFLMQIILKIYNDEDLNRVLIELFLTYLLSNSYKISKVYFFQSFMIQYIKMVLNFEMYLVLEPICKVSNTIGNLGNPRI